jgi:hypothetical protein
MDHNELLFKYYDQSVREEKDEKKIKDDSIFPKTSTTQKIKKFSSLKQKIAKEANALELDTPVYVTTHKQYGVIRKIVKPASQQNEGQEAKNANAGTQYEVRLSTSLENVLVEAADLKRIVSLNIRNHSAKGGEAQNIQIHVRCDSTVVQLLQYISQLSQVPANFINLYHKKKRLANSD